jgi:hypothetical protein
MSQQTVSDKINMDPKQMINHVIGASITAAALEMTDMDSFFRGSPADGVLMNSVRNGVYSEALMVGGRVLRSFVPMIAPF